MMSDVGLEILTWNQNVLDGRRVPINTQVIVVTESVRAGCLCAYVDVNGKSLGTLEFL